MNLIGGTLGSTASGEHKRRFIDSNSSQSIFFFLHALAVLLLICRLAGRSEMGKLPIEKKHGGLKSFAGIISLLRRRSSAQLVSLFRRQDTEQHGLHGSR
jgi:hypothetical protein